ncbi:MAG: ABC transporter substrate-binding protein [Dysgonamonadaceae bacterium]|jgi:iron complex transport system substrate-binding protein|nr:ABC transporter substrate-binding protein [Dysgonamonadaceae bacterium]
MKILNWLTPNVVSQFSIIILCLFFVLSSCRKENNTGSSDITLSGDSIYFAKGFRIETHDDYTLATVRNPWKPERELQRFILIPKSVALPEFLPEGILVRTPLERTVSFGSVQCSFFAEFDALQTLVGVCEPNFINIPFVQNGVREGKIADVGQATNPNLEKIMFIEPEALFTTPIEETGTGQISALNIPSIECVDYMESSPLGRAEWIRFFALFFEKRALADSLFSQTVNNYKALQELTLNLEIRPTVFTETIYSGIWWLPGGNSYMAHFFRDAGADYLWKEDTQTGSIGLSFESVLEKAEKADCWLIKYNSSNELTLSELVKNYPNYAFFDAYKKGNIYICNTGKVTYYEELPIHPDYILKDLVWIFHPELLSGYQPKYYRRIVNAP